MSIDLPLESMTTPQKLEAMEALWANLCKNPSEVESPAWHAAILVDRKRRLESGEATVSDREPEKNRIREFGQSSYESRAMPNSIFSMDSDSTRTNPLGLVRNSVTASSRTLIR